MWSVLANELWAFNSWGKAFKMVPFSTMGTDHVSGGGFGISWIVLKTLWHNKLVGDMHKKQKAATETWDVCFSSTPTLLTSDTFGARGQQNFCKRLMRSTRFVTQIPLSSSVLSLPNIPCPYLQEEDAILVVMSLTSDKTRSFFLAWPGIVSRACWTHG